MVTFDCFRITDQLCIPLSIRQNKLIAFVKKMMAPTMRKLLLEWLIITRRHKIEEKEAFRIFAHFISQFATIVWERAAVGHGQCGKYLEAGEHEDDSRQLCGAENGRLWMR